MAKTSYKNLMNYVDLRDINKMTEKQLRQSVRTLADVANKRVKALSKAYNKTGLPSPALQSISYGDSPHHFSTKGKSKEDLAREFIKARNFLQGKTSTVTGAKEYTEATKKRLGNANLTNEEVSKIFKIYDELQNEIVTRHKGTQPTQEEIAVLVAEGRSSEEIRDYFRLRYEEFEAERTAKFEEYVGSEWDDIE